VESKLAWVVLNEWPKTPKGRLAKVVGVGPGKIDRYLRHLRRLGLLKKKVESDVGSWSLRDFMLWYIQQLDEFCGAKAAARENRMQPALLLALIKQFGKEGAKKLLQYAVERRNLFWFLRKRVTLERIVMNRNEIVKTMRGKNGE